VWLPSLGVFFKFGVENGRVGWFLVVLAACDHISYQKGVFKCQKMGLIKCLSEVCAKWQAFV